MEIDERITSLEEQLASLKQTNRRMQFIGLIGLGIFGILLLMAWLHPPQFKQFISNEYVLIDKSGNHRAMLFIEEDLTGAEDPTLVFFDNNKVERLSLSVSDTGPSISFYASHGGSRLHLSETVCEGCSSVGMTFYDEIASERATIGIADGQTSLRIFDREHQLRAQIFEELETEGMALFNTDGKTIWSAPTTKPAVR